MWFGIDVGAGAIEDIGRGEVDHEEAAISVHDDMALAADDFLAVVVDFRPRVAGLRYPQVESYPIASLQAFSNGLLEGQRT